MSGGEHIGIKLFRSDLSRANGGQRSSGPALPAVVKKHSTKINFHKDNRFEIIKSQKSLGEEYNKVQEVGKGVSGEVWLAKRKLANGAEKEVLIKVLNADDKENHVAQGEIKFALGELESEGRRAKGKALNYLRENGLTVPLRTVKTTDNYVVFELDNLTDYSEAQMMTGIMSKAALLKFLFLSLDILDKFRSVTTTDSSRGEVKKPVVHRDIKPENIMIRTVADDNGKIKDIEDLKFIDTGTMRIPNGKKLILDGYGLVGTPLYLDSKIFNTQKQNYTYSTESDLASLLLSVLALMNVKRPLSSDILEKIALEDPSVTSDLIEQQLKESDFYKGLSEESKQLSIGIFENILKNQNKRDDIADLKDKVLEILKNESLPNLDLEKINLQSKIDFKLREIGDLYGTDNYKSLISELESLKTRENLSDEQFYKTLNEFYDYKLELNTFIDNKRNLGFLASSLGSLFYVNNEANPPKMQFNDNLLESQTQFSSKWIMEQHKIIKLLNSLITLGKLEPENTICDFKLVQEGIKFGKLMGQIDTMIRFQKYDDMELLDQSTKNVRDLIDNLTTSSLKRDYRTMIVDLSRKYEGQDNLQLKLRNLAQIDPEELFDKDLHYSLLTFLRKKVNFALNSKQIKQLKTNLNILAKLYREGQ